LHQIKAQTDMVCAVKNRLWRFK